MRSNPKVKVFSFNGTIYRVAKEVKWINEIPYVECSYLKEFLPISEFAIRKDRCQQGHYVEQPSRRGRTKRDQEIGGKTPKIVKDKFIDGAHYRFCAQMNDWLPIENFWVRFHRGKFCYSNLSRQGKALENASNKQSTYVAIKRWKKKNKHKVNASYKKRQTTKKSACPKWLAKSDLEKIELFYKQSQELTQTSGEIHHVHHIYPLHGTNDLNEHISCGLHVPWNLVVIPAIVNSKIGRRNPEYHQFNKEGQFWKQ